MGTLAVIATCVAQSLHVQQADELLTRQGYRLHDLSVRDMGVRVEIRGRGSCC